MIAVTGANGLLGSFIIRKLQETNTPFVALKRKGSDTSLLADLKDITWREADVLDPIALQESLADVDGVIHTAAIVSFNPREAKKVLQINIEGTQNVVNACLEKGIKRLLHVSSVAALGRQKDQSVINETNQWSENPLNSTYGESKYKAELEIFRGQEEGLSTIIVNPSAILSRGNWANSSAKLFKYVWDEQLFYTDGSFNYVDVRDVANLIFQLYHSPIEGERFILNAGAATFKDFFGSAAKHLQKKGPRIKVSKPILHVIAVFESVRSILFGAEPLITQETARLANAFFLYDNQKVIKAMGYQFLPLESTLAWCGEYYRKQQGKS